MNDLRRADQRLQQMYAAAEEYRARDIEAIFQTGAPGEYFFCTGFPTEALSSDMPDDEEVPRQSQRQSESPGA